MDSENTEYILIDSPVGPYSDIEELQAWVVSLKAMPDRTEVRAAMINGVGVIYY